MVYSVRFTVDEAKKRVYVKVAGPTESARYVDDCIAFFRRLDSAWLYQRLVDFRDAIGTVKYEDARGRRFAGGGAKITLTPFLRHGAIAEVPGHVFWLPLAVS